MAETKIEWCDYTFNSWIGCAKVAAGCEHCYAESYAKRYGTAQWGPHGTRVRTSAAYWRQPLKWNREAAHKAAIVQAINAECDNPAPPVRPRVFCASLADVFEDWDGPMLNSKGEQLWRHPKDPLRAAVVCESRTPLISDPHPDFHAITMDDLRRDLFTLIDATPNLDWLLLTKRPENIRRMWPLEKVAGHVSQNEGDGYAMSRRDNVWLLTSIATQADADRNIPELLKCRDLVPVLGVSAEPLIGPVDLSAFIGGEYMGLGGPVPNYNFGIDWVIVGGESGPGARPCDLEWIESIVKRCKAAGVSCFVKQLGGKPVSTIECLLSEVRDRKGGAMEEWPADLRVREWPQTTNQGA